MSGRATSALPGSTTPILGPLDKTAQERQRHLRQNQEIIRLCSLKSIQARQLQEKMNQLERDNLDLRLALGRKDRDARISKNQYPSQDHYRPNRYRDDKIESFKCPGHSYQSPLSGEGRDSKDLLHQRFSALNTSYQHSLQKPKTSLSTPGRYFSAGHGSPGPSSSTLDRVLGAVETQQELLSMAIRSQDAMINLCQDLIHSTHAHKSHVHFSQIYRASDPTASASSSVRSRSPFASRPTLDQRHEMSSTPLYPPPKWSPMRRHSGRFSSKRPSPKPLPKPSPISTISGIQTQMNFSPVLVFISPHRDRDHATRHLFNAPSRVMTKENPGPSSLGVDTTSLEKSSLSLSTDILKRPVRLGPKSYPNIDQLPTISENDFQDGTSPHVRMEAGKRTETTLSKLTVHETSRPLAGTVVPQAHVPADDNMVDLACGPAKPRGAMSKDKSTKVKPTGSSPVAGSGDRVVTKKSGKNTDRRASSGETRTIRILGSPKQAPVHHRLLGRASLKQLSPGELLKKMNKKLLGRSQTPVLKNTQMSSTLAPTGSSSVWMPKSTRLGPGSSITTNLSSGTTVTPLPTTDLQASLIVGESTSLIKDKENPAKTVPLGDPKLGHEKRHADAQTRQESLLPSCSRESGTLETETSERRYDLRKRKK
ncbi:hypothetical protein BGZ93_011016 [Podila epicladia]|nr:hypothetical protein BGZ92_003419 [Podila epicladia]KAG0098579.1 hypothetical protein BGZ93_011016 [Podila epicladia]